MSTRDLVLGNLLNFSQPASHLSDALKGFEWDFDGEPVTMVREHIKRVLLRYMQGYLTAEDVENWANLIEGREDVDFESPHGELIGECLYQLANPSLTHALSAQRAVELVRLIENS